MALLGSLLTGACSVIGVRSGTEEPRFTVEQRLPGAIEVRRYVPRLAAETTVAGDAVRARGEGFNRLAGYIFGGNQRQARIAMTAPVAQAQTMPSARPGESIAMTAPVAQAATPDGWVIRFFLPTALTNPPRPNDDRVRIAEVPAETVAVLRFSGTTSQDAVADRSRALLAALSGTGWRATGDVVAWFYDPPWTLPPLRRNEVAVPVAKE